LPCAHGSRGGACEPGCSVGMCVSSRWLQSSGPNPWNGFEGRYVRSPSFRGSTPPCQLIRSGFCNNFSRKVSLGPRFRNIRTKNAAFASPAINGA
jgi:hypothetical protein